MSVLHVDNLTHSFGDKRVFQAVSLRLNQGDHAGLIGPNGTGKSTLLKVLGGEILPDAGSVDWLPRTSIGHLRQHLDLQAGQSIRDQLRSAFAHLYDLETEMLQLADQMAEASPADLEKSMQRFGKVQERLLQEGFYDIDVEIERIASGLGLAELGLDSPVDALSGGQRTKVLLAELLLRKPDVLLLDEPTNYLDTGHVEWLTDTLSSYPNAFIVVSHDEGFLNRVTNVVLHLEHQNLTRYPGNLDAFHAAYELRKLQVHEAYAKQREEIRNLETYIAKNKARASTAKQAKSREKRLAKIERIDPPVNQPKPRFRFRPQSHPTSVVMETQGLVVGYDDPLFRPLDLELKRGAKVAITGFNGIGKTTLLKTILGHLPRLDGNVAFGERVVPAYFTQEPEGARNVTAIEEVWAAHPNLTQKEVREALARSGLRGEKVLQPLDTLSGGEQAKVRLCLLMLDEGNWLVLDEPTNHLDANAKIALREALQSFDGTVLLVTHETDFYEGWVTDVWNAAAWKR